MKKIFSIIVIFLMVSVSGFSTIIPTISGNFTPCIGVEYQYTATNQGSPITGNCNWFSLTNGIQNVSSTIISGQGNDTVIIVWNSTGVGQTVILRCTTPDGTGGTPDIIINPVVTPTIYGTNITCKNSIVSYTTQNGMSNYNWEVPVGNTFTGQGTNQISVTWSLSGNQWVKVNYSTPPNGCSAVNPTIYPVTVNYTPTPTITSNQSDTLCSGSNGYYTTQGGGDTYSWDVTGGDKVVQDSVCYVTWNTGPVHTIRVTVIKNGCSSISNYKSVTVITSTTPIVNGESNVCNGNEFSYITDSNKNDYFWTLPDGGGSIQSGQGTDSIVVLWNSPIVNHSVFVRYMNMGLCESSKTKQIFVYPTPQSIINTGDTNIMVEGKSEYSTTPGFTNYEWTVSGGGNIMSNNTLNHITVTWYEIGNQWVKVKYSTGLCTSIPIKYHVSVTPSICMVTYDSVTNRNKIVMTSVSSVIFFHYNIYKLGSTSNYEFIGDVSTLENEFIDTTSIPYQKPYTYKISVVGDTIVSMKSPSHTTIWLHYEKTGNQVDLLWTPYSGFTFDSYHIYRKVGSGSWNQIGLNNNSTLVFTDIYTGTDNPTYYVEVVPPCSTKSSGQTVTSNKVKIGGVGIDSKSYMDVHIFPNPVNKTLTLELQKPGNRMFRVYDLLGKEWLTLSSDQEKINLNVETIPPGIYILKIQSESSTTTTKFCKE